MVERVQVLFEGDASDLNAAAKKAAAGMEELKRSQQKLSAVARQLGVSEAEAAKGIAAADKSAAAHKMKLAGMAAGAVAAAVAMVRLAQAVYGSALSWRDSMREVGAEIPEYIGEGVDSAEDSLGRMQDSFGALSAVLLTEFAPTLETIAGLVQDFAVGAAFVIERASLAWTYLTEGEEAAYQQFLETQGALEQLSRGLDESTTKRKRAGRAVRDMNEDLREQDRLLRLVSGAQSSLLGIADTALADQWSEAEALAIGYGRQLDEIGRISADAIAEATNPGDIAAIQQAAAEARLQVERRYQRDLTALELSSAEERDRATQDRLDEANAQLMDNMSRVRAASAQTNQDSQDDLKTELDRRKAYNALILDSSQAMFDALGDLAKDGSKEQAAIQKAGALFAITVNTAQAITRAFSDLGPILGPPAAAILAGVGAAQAAVVASAKMPSFDRGGVIDGGPQFPGGTPQQRLVQAEDGEVILSRRQARAMGSGGGLTQVNLQLSGRTLQTVLVASGADSRYSRRRGIGQRRFGG